MKKHYKWNDSESEFKIKLGQTKSELLASNSINEIIVNEVINYEGKNSCPWRIYFKDEKVEQIWFDSNCVVSIKGFNLSEHEMKIVIGFLNSHFEEIPELNNKEINLNEYHESDILYVIYADFFLRLVAIIRRETINEKN